MDWLREPEHCITQAMAVFEQVVAGHRRQSADAGPLPHLQTTNDQAGDTARLLRRGEVMNDVGMTEIESVTGCETIAGFGHGPRPDARRGLADQIAGLLCVDAGRTETRRVGK